MAADSVTGLLAGVVRRILGGAAPLSELGQMGANFEVGPMNAMLVEMAGVGAEECVRLCFGKIGVVTDVVPGCSGPVRCQSE